jgi:leucyl/phenylalanyl-tRNA--protein transferase
LAIKFLLPGSNDFPPDLQPDEDGLVAIGGNLQSGTLINAYREGIFPWYSPGEPICWYQPDPRFVLFPKDLIISHSMRNVFNKNLFQFKFNTQFAEVMHQCKYSLRNGEAGSWISDEIEKAYFDLHKRGIAISAEAYFKKELVGGLYGVLLGKVFFGESMFSQKSNASKYAFIKMVELLSGKGVELIDCQIHTQHLQSLGAAFIPGKKFKDLLDQLIT